ncbi:MAG: T9SS type A sorting domain-containing protein [Crocinitomicaceae bacterium]|nr:T9SS type A sorting domain-containing protein [Crocinitomicaceae bacterium]
MLFEVSGKKVFELNDLEGGTNITSLELNNLESGIYLINVFTVSERKIIRLIIH